MPALPFTFPASWVLAGKELDELIARLLQHRQPLVEAREPDNSISCPLAFVNQARRNHATILALGILNESPVSLAEDVLQPQFAAERDVGLVLRAFEHHFCLVAARISAKAWSIASRSRFRRATM